MKRLAVTLLVLLEVLNIFCSGLNIVCQWNQLDFKFPTPQIRACVIRNNVFIQQNVLPIDVDVDYKGI